MAYLRTIFALSRPARLVTVWSNCLAGWWLGGGGNFGSLPVLFIGATLLFLGGSFLNDAFDKDFDHRHRPQRPVPSGQLGHDTVFRWGIALLAVGALLFWFLGSAAGGLGLGLVFFIVLYNAVHRVLPFAPVLKGVCRLLVYLLAAAVAERGVTGWSIWCGLALAAYVAGLRWLENWRSSPNQARSWPVILLSLPVVLALIMDADGFRETGWLLSAVLALWVARCLRPAFWAPERDLARATASLVPGIVFVDWLATCPVALPGQAPAGPRELSCVFLALFGLSVLLQKIAPEMGAFTAPGPEMSTEKHA
jgi:hypothetical protein